MTDRDKRIGELSNLLAITFVEKMKPNGIKYEDIAESIVDDGYQKVSEGDIIIHKDPTKRTEEEIEWLVNHNKEVREEVIYSLRGLLEGYIHTQTKENLFIHTCKKFGVDIKDEQQTN